MAEAIKIKRAAPESAPAALAPVVTRDAAFEGEAGPHLHILWHATCESAGLLCELAKIVLSIQRACVEYDGECFAAMTLIRRLERLNDVLMSYSGLAGLTYADAFRIVAETTASGCGELPPGPLPSDVWALVRGGAA